MPPAMDSDSDITVASTSSVPPAPLTVLETAPALLSACTVGRMRPTSLNTARNLCAKAWLSKHPNGTTHEYAAYWNYIKDTPLGAEWKAAETAAKTAKTKAAAGGL
ncbi:hypothetical protein FISHEDRAFT_79091 [Fistulina hepatica ATCC 64428]|uniref:Uncharacterized protein n=1 Tax=Fistulina hepatica ATCC 64428 TaxID=1128425 RepID=A0A0D6ZZD2_9AGAR|nr:hypothetical protein FISHEDRAFT_79091 [Fistulina hepatica ATCC 64428]